MKTKVLLLVKEKERTLFSNDDTGWITHLALAKEAGQVPCTKWDKRVEDLIS